MDARVELLHRVARTTVTLAVAVPPAHPSVPVLGAQRFGSGVVVDTAGYILTVNYVVLGAASIVVTDVDGNQRRGRVLAQDFYSGVAVVGVEDNDLPAAAPGRSTDLAVGQDAFVLASAGGADRRMSTGFVTSTESFDAYWEYVLDRALWISCINPGLGGAPLFDSLGRIVGVVSLNLGAVARTTLAIPSEHWFDYATELLTHGRRVSRPRRAWLGMFCYSTLPDRVVVAGLMPGAPAEGAGLAVGDVLAEIAGHSVRGRRQAYELLWQHGPAETIDLGIERDGSAETVTVQAADVEEFLG